MPATTAIYGLPYQLRFGDAPDGPALGEDLALAVETELARVDGAVADLDDAAGTLPDEQIFAASGTWTKPTGARLVHVRGIGGGGAGGGAAVTGVGQWSFGDGGGAGECAEGWFLADDLADTVAVTIAAAAAGASGALGADGGVCSFGASLTVNGGLGGAIRGAGTTNFGPNTGRIGGTGGTGGSVRTPGGNGRPGFGITSGANGVLGGDGGDAVLGAGGKVGLNANGGAGGGYGGGGGGATNSASQVAARTGGAGATGVIIVTTYF